MINHPQDLLESGMGTKCKLFNIEKIGDEHVLSFPILLLMFPMLVFQFPQYPQSMCHALYGLSKDIINEINRNLADTMSITYNVFNLISQMELLM